METKIKLMIQAKPKDTAGWPHINFNYEQAAGQICEALKQRMPDALIDTSISSDVEAAKNEFPDIKKQYDGLVLITATNAPCLYDVYCDMADTRFPVLIADLPHAGSGGFLSAATRVCKEHLPIGLAASMDYGDIAENAQLIEVLKRIKKEKILIISDNPANEMFAPGKIEALKQNWGCETVIKNSQDIFSLYNSVSEQQALPLAEKWLTHSIRSVEPSKEEIVKSAKLYYVLEELKKQTGSTAVTVDCLSLFYKNRMKAYPCLSFFEMLNQGNIGICEADVQSIMRNWNMDIFGWHRVTVYGDWREKLLNLAQMKGMDIYEEDKY